MKYYAVIFSLLFFGNSFSQNSTVHKDVGSFHFEAEVVDYGTIQQNDNGVRVFKFTNRGDAPIVIFEVKTTCGCTIPSFPKKAILPGDTGEISIKYATHRVGAFTKSITVISNAEEAQKVLKIKGIVLSNTQTTAKL